MLNELWLASGPFYQPSACPRSRHHTRFICDSTVPEIASAYPCRNLGYPLLQYLRYCTEVLYLCSHELCPVPHYLYLLLLYGKMETIRQR
jgi:hypothetical protein